MVTPALYAIFSERSCSLYVVVGPSVCLSSVTFVRPTQATESFGNVSTTFGTLRRSFQGNPSVKGLNARGVAKYSDFRPVEGYISERVQDKR